MTVREQEEMSSSGFTVRFSIKLIRWKAGRGTEEIIYFLCNTVLYICKKWILIDLTTFTLHLNT